MSLTYTTFDTGVKIEAGLTGTDGVSLQPGGTGAVAAHIRVWEAVRGGVGDTRYGVALIWLLQLLGYLETQTKKMFISYRKRDIREKNRRGGKDEVTFVSSCGRRSSSSSPVVVVVLLIVGRESSSSSTPQSRRSRSTVIINNS